MKVVLILALVVIVGLLLTSLQVLLVGLRLRRARKALKQMPIALDAVCGGPAREPEISVLKPICGLEDGLEENLASFANLSAESYEVILSIADRVDPAVGIAERVMQRFPDAPFRLVVGGVMRGLVANPKVERLIAAARIARGSILFISDSNVRVSPEDLARTVSLFDDPAVGLASDLFVAGDPKSFGSAVEALHLLTFVLPASVLAQWAGAVCVVGKSMAVRRQVCEQLGGFESFSQVLAEDQAMGIAVREAGFEVVGSSVVVRNITETRSLRGALDRQIRWGKIRYAFSKYFYICEFALNPLPLALVACVWSLAFSSGELRVAELSLLATVVRLAQAGILSRLTGARLSSKHVMLTPVQDILQFAAQLVPLFSSEVNWRGHRTRLGPGTVMLSSRHSTEPTESHPSLNHKPI
jgi:ceramide glucosyltransferase